MNKYLKYFIINLLIIIIALFSIERIIWVKENNKMLKNSIFTSESQKLPFHKGIKKFNPDFISFQEEEKPWGRSPNGLKYKKQPIAIFGCSFAYGYNMEPNQTLSYKLSEYTKRPVYNRAWIGWGIQHMLYQARSEILYEQVPEPEYLIYVYTNDHLRRLYLLTFSSWNLLEEDFYLRYKEKNNDLIEIKHTNFFINQIKRLYLTNKFHHWYVKKFVLAKRKNNEEFAAKHFIEAKNEFQKHWKNTKYVVLFYNDKTYNNYLKKNLAENGFIVIDTSELTDENLSSEKYALPDTHPKETSWDLIVPLISKKLNL